MHVFGDRPFVDHYLWWPPLTQEINRLVCCFGTNELSVFLLGCVFKVGISLYWQFWWCFRYFYFASYKTPHLITCGMIIGAVFWGQFLFSFSTFLTPKSLPWINIYLYHFCDCFKKDLTEEESFVIENKMHANVSQIQILLRFIVRYIRL